MSGGETGSVESERRFSPGPEADGEELRSEVMWLRAELKALRRDHEALLRELASKSGPASMASAATSPAPPPTPLAPTTTAPPPTSDGAPPAAFVPPPLPALGIAGGPQQGIDFGAVAQLTPDKLDGLPYGLITLDARGRVIHYNDTESRLVGLPKDRVIGRNFFREIAPCTRIREFEGRFNELAADPFGIRVQSFDFVFKFARGEQHVSVVMTPGRIRGQFHLALLRRARSA